MFIPPLRNQQLNPLPTPTKFVPDLSFDNEQSFIEYIQQTSVVTFKTEGFLGFTEVIKKGFAPHKNITLTYLNQNFVKDTVFIVKNNKFKESFDLTFVKVIHKENKTTSIKNSKP